MTREELEEEATKTYLETEEDNKYLDEGELYNVAYLAGAEPREKRIADLEQKLEQAEKDLADYQFNYPTIKELQKENAELTCQMKRNVYCYSCTNATEKCYKKEIGCPCGNYKSYKDENAELKDINAHTLSQLNLTNGELILQLAKAKELLKKWVELYKPKLEGYSIPPIQEQTEQFLNIEVGK